MRITETYDHDLHRSCQKLHAGNRTLERFGKQLAPVEIERCNRMVWESDGTLVAFQPMRRFHNEVWDLTHQGLKMRVVYNARTKTICTVLTRDVWNHYWVPVDGIQDLGRAMKAQGNLKIEVYEGQPPLYIYASDGHEEFPRLLAKYLKRHEQFWTCPEKLCSKLVNSLMDYYQGKEILGVCMSPIAPEGQTISVFMQKKLVDLGLGPTSFETFAREDT